MVINFGELILSELQKQKMSQYELAQKSGVSSQNINRYCNSKRSPSLDKADKILKALGAQIVLGSDDPKGPAT